jgi:hypothetical protein
MIIEIDKTYTRTTKDNEPLGRITVSASNRSYHQDLANSGINYTLSTAPVEPKVHQGPPESTCIACEG